MARAATFKLPQPMFHEPVFEEGQVTPDPTGFMEDHPSDKELYKEVEKLLKTEVVGFEKSRVAPDALYTLAEALGDRGKDVTDQIEAAGRLVFHAIGDSGTTNESWLPGIAKIGAG